MLIIGLTGSIGMGKTTIANYMAECGVPVLDADRAVHRLYSGRAVPIIDAAFPGVTENGQVDRAKLTAALQKMPDGFAKLEGLVHPLVRHEQWRFLKEQEAAGARLCVLDIPLLFETGGNDLTDVTIVVSAPEEIQTARVLARPGMTPEKLAIIRARQMPDAEKRVKADYIIETGLPLDETKAQVDKLLESLKGHVGDKFSLWRERYGESAGGPDSG